MQRSAESRIKRSMEPQGRMTHWDWTSGSRLVSAPYWKSNSKTKQKTKREKPKWFRKASEEAWTTYPGWTPACEVWVEKRKQLCFVYRYNLPVDWQTHNLFSLITVSNHESARTHVCVHAHACAWMPMCMGWQTWHEGTHGASALEAVSLWWGTISSAVSVAEMAMQASGMPCYKSSFETLEKYMIMIMSKLQ